MKKLILAGAAVLVLAGSTAVYAQYRSEHHMPGHLFHMRMTSEDMSAFADARIAAVKAGLKLTPEQEKNWPAVEAAVKDFAKLRIERANASRDRQPPEDPVARLRERAQTMAATAAAMSKIVDAADPLYKSLDDGQKRRLAVLTRMGGHHGWHRGEFGGRGGERMHDRDDGPGRERGPGPGPERL